MQELDDDIIKFIITRLILKSIYGIQSRLTPAGLGNDCFGWNPLVFPFVKTFIDL